MIFDDSFRMVGWFAFLLDRYLHSTPMVLHWSIQPGVSDGCLEWFSTAEAAQQHYDTVGKDWQGAPGPAMTLVQLQIRADRLGANILCGKMVIKDGKLRVYEELVAGPDRYSLSLIPNHSMPALLAIEGSAPPPSLHQLGGGAGAIQMRLYGGFLKEYVRSAVCYAHGLHWSMQPGANGRITLSSDPKQYAGKYAYDQKAISFAGPEIEQVVLTMSEQAATKILASGALVRGEVAGKFYMYVKIDAVCYFDQARAELAYTTAIYTPE